MGQVERRQFLAATGALIAGPIVWAQSGSRMPRVAFVVTTSPVANFAGPAPVNRHFGVFVHQMRTRGWIEGQNFVIDRRSAEGRFERAPDIFLALAKDGVDVIITVGPVFVKAAMKAAPTVPIVAMVGSPVEAGIVKSLARPGGNVTGVTSDVGLEFHAKNLGLLKDTLPKAKTVALLTQKIEGTKSLVDAAIHDAARTLGLELFDAAWSSNTFDAAFKLIETRRPDAVLVRETPPHHALRAEIVNFARRARLPDFHGYRDAVEIGGLSSYGIDLSDMHRKVADYVDRILRGARAGDLAIERPGRFELAINLKTAKALGLTIPQSVLLQATEIIE